MVPAPGRHSVRLLIGSLVVAIPLVAACGSSSPSTAQLASSSTCASVYPSPGTHTASTTAQISLRYVAPGSLSSGTVSVSGSKSGAHSGRWVTDSDKLGASFYPTSPFTAGETVTVSMGVRICGAVGNSSTFATAVRPGPLAAKTAPAAAAPQTTPDQPSTTYASLPNVKIPALAVKIPANFGGSYIFETPRGGTLPAGPMIVNGSGQVIWFDPLPGNVAATDFRTQTHEGQPVLTWWQGGINPQTGAPSAGHFVIMNSHYQIIKTFTVGNGYASDEHDFIIPPSGNTAWVVAAQEIGSNLTSLGGPKNGAVVDEIAQELDLATGNVLFEWHSLDHVPVTDSYFGYSPSAAYDYFHMNSIDPLSTGTIVISSRHTHAVYAVTQTTGHLVWELGGKHSSFTMEPGANFALQHDARIQTPTTISIFDDEDAAPSNASARAIVLRLDFTKHTATLVRALTPDALKVAAQGNQQILANGNTVVGWGSGSATSVFSPSGKLIFDATFGTTINSYRAYLLPWSGTPTTPPSIAASSANGKVNVYASWNGSTATTSWKVMGGSSSTSLKPLAITRRSGFQTTITIPTTPRYVEVLALNAGGQTLGTSAVISPKNGAQPAVVKTP